MTPTLSIPIDSIVIGERLRKDLGDIDDLAASLAKLGLIHPIVINANNELIAGGRRLTAAKQLGWSEIKVNYFETIDEAHKQVLEVEENVKRKAITWQEELTAISKIHKYWEREAILAGKPWGLSDTATQLDRAKAYISYANTIAKELGDPNSPVHAATGIVEAIKALAKKREDETLAEIARRTVLTTPAAAPLSNVQPDLLSSIATPEPIEVQITPWLLKGNSLDLIPNLTQQCHHIICDPPYAIDMDNLAQQNQGMIDIDRVAASHNVDANIAMFPRMLQVFYNALPEKGFCIIWCDIMSWQFLYDVASQIGFRVQRWPITWVKVHKCMNNAAHQNFTKTTEIAMVMRKGTATLPKPIETSVVIASSQEDRRIYNHPFVKPFDVWKFLIEAVTIQGETILDPFAGVGSSTLSAIALGRKAIAIELEDNHYNNLLENVKAFYTARLGNNINFS